jgi:hypothetical protein
MNHLRQFFFKLGFTASMLLWASIAVTPAMAAPIQFSFTGVVSHVQNSLFTSPSPTFYASQTLTGSYTFNSLTGDSNSNGNIGRYNGTIEALTVNLGPSTSTLGGGSNFIEIRNYAPGSGSDRYVVQAPLTGGTGVNGFTPVRFRIELIDPTGTAFSSDTLAGEPSKLPPSLSSFATSRFRLIFSDDSGTARIRGTLTSLTMVPLPAAVILFGAGLGALAGLGAGSWRQKKNSIA